MKSSRGHRLWTAATCGVPTPHPDLPMRISAFALALGLLSPAYLCAQESLTTDREIRILAPAAGIPRLQRAVVLFHGPDTLIVQTGSTQHSVPNGSIARLQIVREYSNERGAARGAIAGALIGAGVAVHNLLRRPTRHFGCEERLGPCVEVRYSAKPGIAAAAGGLLAGAVVGWQFPMAVWQDSEIPLSTVWTATAQRQ